MLKKDLLMSQVVAQSAALLRKLRTEIMAAVVFLAKKKCSLLSVQTAGKKLQFLSNLQATNLFIAAIVTNHVLAAIGKMLKQTLLGQKPRRVFYVY
jgi:hypothetical protein